MVEWEKFTINMEQGVPLKIDDLAASPEDIRETLIEAIHKAEAEAIRNGIKNNAILLNSEFNLTKSFYYSMGDQIKEISPMLLGKAVYLDTDKILPKDTAFALFEANVKNEDDELRELLRKYVKTDGESLRFKHISYKRNKKDFEKILSIICY